MDTLPPFHNAALMLDMDGTLIDIAPTPDAVIVPPGLREAVAALRDHLDGALAIVTGRPIDTVDRLFDDAPGAVAGEHGGAIRFGSGQPVLRPELPGPPAAWLREAEALVEHFPGALLERKARGFALHYRLAPEAAGVFHDALRTMVAADPSFQLMPAHMLWEVRPAGADKGRAVAALMQRDPFQGRVPVFIGDDVTDEDGMREARRRGGAGFRVAPVFGDSEGVRQWVMRSAELGAWASLP